jgi:hypothetical protein
MLDIRSISTAHVWVFVLAAPLAAVTASGRLPSVTFLISIGALAAGSGVWLYLSRTGIPFIVLLASTTVVGVTVLITPLDAPQALMLRGLSPATAAVLTTGYAYLLSSVCVSIVRLFRPERRDWDPSDRGYQVSYEYAHEAHGDWFPSFFRVMVAMAILVLLFMLLLRYGLIPV